MFYLPHTSTPWRVSSCSQQKAGGCDRHGGGDRRGLQPLYLHWTQEDLAKGCCHHKVRLSRGPSLASRQLQAAGSH